MPRSCSLVKVPSQRTRSRVLVDISTHSEAGSPPRTIPGAQYLMRTLWVLRHKAFCDTG